MDTGTGNGPDAMAARTTVERTSDRELVVTRTFNAPARFVFEAWSRAELFQRWWVPKSFGLTLLSCELDVRVGGGYRLLFSHPAAPEPVAFHGSYLEVQPHSRLVWSNDEAGGSGQVTTVTFEEHAGQTLLVMRDLYPSKEALDEAIASGSAAASPGDQSGIEETFAQLDQLFDADGGESTAAPSS
ncbi:MAG: SRPBCC domain-containing protein [Dehalococcoidia bacterium]